MHSVDMSTGGHNWEKQNLVTITKGGKHYDIQKCSLCGIKGKSHNLSHVSISGQYSIKNAEYCKNAERTEIEKIQITKCTAVGEMFANLTPESIHDVIKAPESQEDDHRGVWVMGVGVPVKVLNSEFNSI